jgi:hypothetical protein
LFVGFWRGGGKSKKGRAGREKKKGGLEERKGGKREKAGRAKRREEREEPGLPGRQFKRLWKYVQLFWKEVKVSLKGSPSGFGRYNLKSRGKSHYPKGNPGF